MRRFRLRPNQETTKTLQQWFGSCRLTYNWALSCIKNKPKVHRLSVTSLRKRFINACNIPKKYKFLLDVPKHVRDTAIIDQGFQNNFAKKKANPEHTFVMKFRSKKENQAITIPKTALHLMKDDKDSCLKMYPTYLKNAIKFFTRKEVANEVFYDCKLTLDKLGRFYLIIPMLRSPKSEGACENQTSKEEWASVDPGVRTFGTLYSPTIGVAFKLGDKDISRIYRLCRHLDKLLGKKIRGKNKAIQKLRLRIHHLVDEVHWKVIRFLLDNFKGIIIPPFNTSQMVKKQNRKISSQTVRKMLTWRHFTFRQRLITKAQEEGVEVFVMGEEWTTKTCTHCLKINHAIKGEKILKCPHCHTTVDRDLGGARSIFTKNISALEKSKALPR